MRRILNVRHPVSVVVAAAFLVGCGEKISPEQACLDAERINFSDPHSVKVVKNLGKRWANDDGDYFWVRYSAANLAGGVQSSNMVCKRIADGAQWKRDETIENRAVEAMTAYVSKMSHMPLWDNPGSRTVAKAWAYAKVDDFPQDLQPAPPRQFTAEQMRPR